MQRILITGGAGFIGSNFVRMMLGKYPDIAITVYDKLTYAGRLENLQDIAINYPDRYHFIQGDICDAAAVEQAIAGRQIDAIVNFAAETHVDRSILDPDAFIQTDIYGTYVLLEAARRAGNLRYHQISTDEVYGHVEGSHRSLETDNVAPRSPYAASKAGADHLVNAYFITYGLPITISRSLSPTRSTTCPCPSTATASSVAIISMSSITARPWTWFCAKARSAKPTTSAPAPRSPTSRWSKSCWTSCTSRALSFNM